MMNWDILAGLRFFLAWIVFSSHVSHFVSHRDFLIRFDYFGGHAAVLGFLLVSGYSIAHSVSKSTKGFYKRRLLRIYPLYLAAIIISLVPFLVSGQNVKEYTLPSITNFIGNLFFLQGFSVYPLASNGIVWTLSIEVCCYLLAPFFLKLGYKKLLFLIAVSSICYVLFPRLPLELGNGRTNSLYGIPFLLLLWAWLLGFVFYLQAQQKAMQILLIGLGCALIISSYNYYGVGKLALITYILSALILIYSSRLQFPKMVLKVFRYLGDLSYPFYLFHFSSIFFGYSVLRIDNSFYQLILSLVVTVAAYHLIDVPLRHGSQLSIKAGTAWSSVRNKFNRTQ
jgi:peptidoglycan/LPS O-acetylase OafA/YrhL